MKYGIKTLACKHFLIGMVLVCLSMTAVAQNPYIVTASSLNVRNSPSSEAQVIGKVVKGDTVLVNKVEANWAQIPFGLRYGYVSISYLSQVNPERKPVKEYETTYTAPKTTYSKPKYNQIVDYGNGTYKVDDRVLNTSELISYFQDNCPAAYKEILDCSNVSRRCNIGWFCLGLPAIALIITGACLVKDDPIAGGACLGLGGTCATACVPLIIVSVVKSKNAVSNGVEAYNAQCSRRYAQTPVEFQIQTSNNGIGFAMNF